MLYAQKVRYTAQTVRMMSEPTCDPTVSVSSPISGGEDAGYITGQVFGVNGGLVI